MAPDLLLLWRRLLERCFEVGAVVHPIHAAPGDCPGARWKFATFRGGEEISPPQIEIPIEGEDNGPYEPLGAWRISRELLEGPPGDPCTSLSLLAHELGHAVIWRRESDPTSMSGRLFRADEHSRTTRARPDAETCKKICGNEEAAWRIGGMELRDLSETTWSTLEPTCERVRAFCLKGYSDWYSAS